MVGYLTDMELSETSIFYFKQTDMLSRTVTLSELLCRTSENGSSLQGKNWVPNIPPPLGIILPSDHLKGLDVKESKTGKYKRRYPRNVTFTYNLLEVLKEGGMRDKQ